MGQVKKGISLLALSICLLLFPTPSFAETDGQILLEGRLDIQESKTFRIPVTNMPIEFTGPEYEKTFYYEINAKPTTEDNELVLSLKHSELLIAPSSVTVYVDEEPVVSKAIDENQSTNKVVVPLTGDALEKGFHSVKVSFYGVIIEGVCVAQESSGNWMTLGIDSYFQLGGEQQEPLDLSDYPSRFIGTEKRPVVVIIPEEASLETLDSGLKVAAYLAEQAVDEEAVQFVRESAVEEIIGEVILLGAQDEFQSPFVKELLDKANIPTTQDALVLSQHMLVEGAERAEMLVVTGDFSTTIEERIAILFTDDLMKQLSGQQMVIKTIPEVSKEGTEQTVSLKKLGIPNLTLDSLEPESEQFFYYAPTAIGADGKTMLELHLKRSETISSFKEAEENPEESLENDVELTVFVNEVPHSIDIRSLTEDENGVYTIRIPLNAKSMSDNRLFSLQFQANGLRKKNPCIAIDQNHWIYIADDSSITFSGVENAGAYTLAKFPMPFLEEKERAVVILPDSEEVDDTQLLSLYRSMHDIGLVPQWKLERAGELVEEELKDQHLLFLGGPRVHSLLQEKHSELVVDYAEDTPNLGAFGFLQEAVEKVSWIQPSPWNEKQAMLVFDHLEQSTAYVDGELLDFLKQTDEVATVAVKMNNEQIYTNASQLGLNVQQDNEEQSVEEKSAFSVWTIIGFITLVLVTILLIYFVLRRQKRKEE